MGVCTDAMIILSKDDNSLKSPLFKYCAVEQTTHAFVLCLPSAGKQCYACVLLNDFLLHCADVIIVAGAYSAVPSQIE